ncbi:MAG TPA: outer membrane protein assembly factor BamE [Thermoanaerobaculia bacterium]|jgi:hypothetical protein|nr:outer membrane protein assembly factor BamE [Thermoanaerobaculia bacterium]
MALSGEEAEVMGNGQDPCNITRLKWSLRFLSFSLLVFSLLSVGCASTGKAVAKLEPGMTKQQVLSILGSPADRSFREKDEAWQYREMLCRSHELGPMGLQRRRDAISDLGAESC